MDRRTFLLSSAAATAALPASAQTRQPYILPEDHIPRYVRISGRARPYELHVVPREFALYWTLPNQYALRYAVGIGRPGLYEAGEFFIGAKKVWPSWVPTDEMIERDPEEYAQWADGMPGGPENPLGARALYLFDRARGDTFLRIHGTGQPRTIGREVSNGCARLINSHIIHLYGQVPLRTRAVLHPKL